MVSCRRRGFVCSRVLVAEINVLSSLERETANLMPIFLVRFAIASLCPTLNPVLSVILQMLVSLVLVRLAATRRYHPLPNQRRLAV